LFFNVLLHRIIISTLISFAVSVQLKFNASFSMFLLSPCGSLLIVRRLWVSGGAVQHGLPHDCLLGLWR